MLKKYQIKNIMSSALSPSERFYTFATQAENRLAAFHANRAIYDETITVPV